MNEKLNCRLGKVVIDNDRLRVEEKSKIDVVFNGGYHILILSKNLNKKNSPLLFNVHPLGGGMRKLAPAGNLGLEEHNLVGSSDFYLNQNNNLVMYDGGGEGCGGIPKAVAYRFGELIRPELKKRGFVLSGVVPYEGRKEDGYFSLEGQMDDFWINNYLRFHSDGFNKGLTKKLRA